MYIKHISDLFLCTIHVINVATPSEQFGVMATLEIRIR
jgi:hypothetical protein